MSKAADMGKVSAKGSFHLLWGLVASTVISSIGTIFIARLLGSDLYGLYSVVIAVPALIGMFRDWGINLAMVRCAAQYRAEGRATEVRSVFVSGFIFEIAVGVVLSVITFLLAGFIADIYESPGIAPLIQLAAISILAVGITNAATAAFTGIERMELNSIMLICQSVIKTAFILLLVSPLFSLGTLGAIIGYISGMSIAGVLGIVLVWKVYRELPKSEYPKLEISTYIKTMLTYGVPLSIAGLINGFMMQFFMILLPLYYTDFVAIGNYTIAMTFIVLITFFAQPITTMLFPAFSKLDHKKDHEIFQNIYQLSIKYASLLVVPVSVLIMVLAEPAISALFEDSYSMAPLFLALLAITYIYTAFGGLTTSNLINSQGQTKYNLKLTIITAAIGFPAGLVLILNFGVMGLIAITLTAGLPSMYLSIRWIKNKYGLTVDWLSSARILLSSALAGTLTYLLIEMLDFSPWPSLFVGTISFILIFVSAALFTRTITRYDINNIRLMLSGIGVLGQIFNYLLAVVEKIMNVFRL